MGLKPRGSLRLFEDLGVNTKVEQSGVLKILIDFCDGSKPQSGGRQTMTDRGEKKKKTQHGSWIIPLIGSN